MIVQAPCGIVAPEASVIVPEVKLTLPPQVVEAAVAIKPLGRVSTSGAVNMAAVAFGLTSLIVAVLSAPVSTCVGENDFVTLGGPPAPVIVIALPALL